MTTGRRACTSGEKCQPRSLAEVLYCVVHHSRIDAGQLADRIGVRKGYLLDAANPDRDEVQFQARWIVPVTLASGNDALLRYLADQCGGVFFAVPQIDDAGSDVVQDTAKAVEAFGALLQCGAQAWADRHVSEAEAQTVAQCASAAIAAIAQFAALMQEKAGINRRGLCEVRR